jgi:GntR family transcriptional regulator
MRLWLNRTGEVSLREQLRMQVVLSILSGELAPGKRLPSTRELARRFGIHANTASAAYRQLEEEGWLEFRHGSGVFVRNTRPTGPLSPEMESYLAVDRLIGELVAKARDLGAAGSLVRSRMRHWLSMEAPSRWLVIEPEPELRSILVFELEKRLKLPVSGCAPEECPASGRLQGAMPLALPNRAEMVRTALPPEVALVILQIHPVAPSLQEFMPAPEEALIGIASRWKEFHRIAHTMMIASGIPPESLLIRDAASTGWKRGLEQVRAIVCDAATESHLPKGPRAISYRLIAEATITQLQQVETNLSSDSADAQP